MANGNRNGWIAFTILSLVVGGAATWIATDKQLQRRIRRELAIFKRRIRVIQTN